MLKMKKPIKALLAEADGATAIEYGLIAALIAFAAIIALGTIGTNLSRMYTNVSSSIDAPVEQANNN